MIKILQGVLRCSYHQVEINKSAAFRLHQGTKIQNNVSLIGNPVREFSNCHRASITRVNRLQFLYQYPTTVVNPDGSTYTIRYQTPRKIIKLPVDVSLLSDSAKNARLERRKQKTKVKFDEEFEEESFDSKKYLKYVKK